MNYLYFLAENDITMNLMEERWYNFVFYTLISGFSLGAILCLFNVSIHYAMMPVFLGLFSMLVWLSVTFWRDRISKTGPNARYAKALEGLDKEKLIQLQNISYLSEQAQKMIAWRLEH